MISLLSRSLILYDTEVGDDGLRSLVARLPHGLTSLTLILSVAVNLRSTKVSDGDLKSLAAGLPHGLTSLDLRIDKKNIGDEGVIALIDAVTKLPNSWHALSFNSERVSDSAGKTINLDLINTKVGDDDLKSLPASCRIAWPIWISTSNTRMSAMWAC